VAFIRAECEVDRGFSRALIALWLYGERSPSKEHVIMAIAQGAEMTVALIISPFVRGSRTVQHVIQSGVLETVCVLDR